MNEFIKAYTKIISECNTKNSKKHIIKESSEKQSVKLDLLTFAAISLAKNGKFDEKICNYIGQIPIINDYAELAHMSNKTDGLKLLYNIIYYISKNASLDEFMVPNDDIDDISGKYVLTVNIEPDPNRCLKLIARALRHHGLFVGEKNGCYWR